MIFSSVWCLCGHSCLSKCLLLLSGGGGGLFFFLKREGFVHDLSMFRYPSRNRLSPRFINKSTTNIQLLDTNTTPHPKKRKEQNDDNRCTLRRITTALLAPNRRVPSSTLKKESTRYGFPRHSGMRTKGCHDALQEGEMPSTGGTASVSSKPIRISPTKTLSAIPDDPPHRSPRGSASPPPE